MLSKDDWIVTIDISDAHLTIPLDEEFKDCHFPISGNCAVFHQIVAIYGLPDIDIFASALNHQVKRYVSWIEDPRAQAIDAFSVSWGEGVIS